jgi:hypothetical protein
MYKKKVLMAVLGTLLLLILLAWHPWGLLLYHGDGKFSDKLFFYPRYRVRFADVPLNEAGEHHFHFGGLPNQETTLMLYVKGPHADWKNENFLTHFPVTLEAKLTDGQGNIACQAIGRPAGGNRDGVWVLMSGLVAGYWHYRCTSVRVSPFKTYDLMIRVTDVGPQSRKTSTENEYPFPLHISHELPLTPE